MLAQRVQLGFERFRLFDESLVCGLKVRDVVLERVDLGTGCWGVEELDDMGNDCGFVREAPLG